MNEKPQEGDSWINKRVSPSFLFVAGLLLAPAIIVQQNLTVEAALTGKREHIYHAAMLDPHTAAELDLDQIWSLVDDLIEAHGDWLPEYH